MALDKTRLATGIITALKALNPNIDASSEAALQPYWEAISDEIIKEITVNMEIQTNVEVPGVQAGPSTVFGTGTETSIS